MGNDNDACDTRLTLGLASTDLIPKRNQEEEKNVTICLDLCIPLHANDHGTKTEGSSSKTCENDEKQETKSTISLRNFNYKIDNKNNGMRKKLRLTIEQSTLLEESFKRHTTLAMGQKQELAAKLKLKPRQVEVWFQNRRARTKLKQTEVDCEMLKKWCQSLNNENNRLKKELQELRSSFKIDQWPITPFHLQLPKPRTIALCASCQKISRSGTNDGNHIERAAVLIENINSEQKQCDAMCKGENSDNIFIKESNKQ